VTAYVASHELNEGTSPSLAILVRDISEQISKYGSLAKMPADAVGNTRNDMYLASEAIRFLMKDKASELTADEIKTLNAYKASLDLATKFIPTWVKVAVAIALGFGTMVGLEADRRDGGGKNRQDSLDVCTRCLRGNYSCCWEVLKTPTKSFASCARGREREHSRYALRGGDSSPLPQREFPNYAT
jgi:hypothetical protein